MRKSGSTNAINEKIINDSCGMAYSLSVIGGRWKPAILCRLLSGTKRYSELKRSIENISERMLVSQLRELENAKLINRIVYAEVPPRVEYQVTDLGETMRAMIQSMSDWGNMHRKNTEAQIDDVSYSKPQKARSKKIV